MISTFDTPRGVGDKLKQYWIDIQYILIVSNNRQALVVKFDIAMKWILSGNKPMIWSGQECIYSDDKYLMTSRLIFCSESDY